MLWLAGLMGLAGVGAASFIGLTSADAEDEEEEEQSFDEEELASETSTNLLHDFHDPGQTDDAYFSSNAVSAAPEDTSSVGWGDDILNEVMVAFDHDEDNDAGQLTETDTNIEPFLLENPINADGDDDVGPSSDYSLSEWIMERSGSEILDYTAESESLMLIWDDVHSDADEPDVDVTPDPDDPEVMQVTMNGENVAEVYGDAEMDASDLTLIPLSSAIVIGLAPAVTNLRPQNRAV